MKSYRFFPVAALFICFFVPPAVYAVIDNNASVVKLRTTCQEGTTTLDNCFTDSGQLSNWIHGTRSPAPSAAAPLLVEIGPGIFGQLFCGSSQASSHITYKGAGMGKTKILTMTILNCTELSFSDMTLTGANANYAVFLGQAGTTGSNTSWINVEMLDAWFEQSCGSTRGKHYWFNSRIIISKSSQSPGYKSSCDESWFFGSEITSIVTGNSLDSLHALQANGNGEIHVYGSVIRALNNGTGVASGTNYAAVFATNGAEIHIHGTGIDVLSNSASPIVALHAASGGNIHANGAAYNLKSSGTVTRISKDTHANTHVHAPYLWEEHSTPPNIVSANGADMAVATDGVQPHLLIYSSNCTSKWFDTSTNVCRP